MHRFIRRILRYIIRHKRLNKIFSRWKWFNRVCYEEAQAVIGNIELILITEGQHDPQFKLGDFIKYTPSEVAEILRKHADEFLT